MDTQNICPKAAPVEIPYNASGAPQAAAAVQPDYSAVNFVVRFGFSPAEWQRPEAEEEANENRSGGDDLSSRSTSWSSDDGGSASELVDDGSALGLANQQAGGHDNNKEEDGSENSNVTEAQKDSVATPFTVTNLGTGRVQGEVVDHKNVVSNSTDHVDATAEALKAYNEELLHGSECLGNAKGQIGGAGASFGGKQLLSDKLSPSSFASTTASGPSSFLSSSTLGSSWQADASSSSSGSAAVAQPPQVLAGYSSFGTQRKRVSFSDEVVGIAIEEGVSARSHGHTKSASDASGPLLERKRPSWQRLVDVEADGIDETLDNRPSSTEVVRAQWRVACPVLALTVTAGVVAIVLLVGLPLAQEA